jgi:hypothetical protein
MLDILWDIHQQRRINDAEDMAGTASRRASDLQHRLHFLEQQVDKLLLINTAMWSLMRGQLGLTEKHLLDRMRQIDLEDGAEDGKITRPATDCPQCGRTFSARHNRCLYCGHAPEPESALG